jgi:hydroxyacylglutathione hydrolase
MTLEIVQLACRTDNYAVLLHDAQSDKTAAVDTPDGAVIEAELARRGWRLTTILTTHHHGDHTAGHATLAARHGCAVVASDAEFATTPAATIAVREGSLLRFAGRDVLVLDTPGHTKGHVSYHLPSDGVAFVGDTLFAMGCGRLLEDSADAMWASLRKLAELPSATRLYCGHEYTLANARFAATVDADNPALRARLLAVEAARAADRPTLPTTVAEERATNPFLRAGDPAVQAAVGMAGAAPGRVFAELRTRKDRFKG